MKKEFSLLIFLLALCLIIPTVSSGGDPNGPVYLTAIQLESNSTYHYDADGYVTLNWTQTTTADVGVANVTIWISSDQGTTWSQNGTNTSTGGFDFYGTSANWTFRLQPFNVSGSAGENVSYNSSSDWFVIDKTIPTGLAIESNSSNYYDSDGYITLNWTACSGMAPIRNYTVWVNESHGEYSMNGSNTSATSFDFYGITGNYTFVVSWSGGENGDIFDGNNLTWANGSYWFMIEKTSATTPTISHNAYFTYDEGYVTFNWTAPSTDVQINNYTLWLSTDNGVTYVKNSSNTSATGVDFYGIEANYTNAKIQWFGGSEGSYFDGGNLTRGGNNLWLQIDKTAPVIGFTCTDVPAGQASTCICSATDALSDVSTRIFTEHPVVSSTVTQTQTCTATDNVGNSASTSTTYNVYQTGGDTTPPNPSTSHTWDQISSDETALMPINHDEIDFTNIELDVVSDVSNPSIKLELLSDEPECGDLMLSNIHYQYVDITTTNLDDSNIESAFAEFKVSQSWISDNNIDSDSISLYRCFNGQWIQTVTSSTNEDSEYAYYESVLPGFSYFAITGSEEGTICDNDYICEPIQGENENNCPNDCPGDTPTCVPDTTQCFGNELKQCNSVGSAWETLEICEHGCSDGECQKAPSGDITLIIIIFAIVIVVLVLYRWFMKK